MKLKWWSGQIEKIKCDFQRFYENKIFFQEFNENKMLLQRNCEKNIFYRQILKKEYYAFGVATVSLFTSLPVLLMYIVGHYLAVL